MKKHALILFSGVVAFGSGCTSPPEPNGTRSHGGANEAVASSSGSLFNSTRAPVKLTGASAIIFAKSTSIPWRSHGYSLDPVLGSDRRIPRPLFRRYGSDEVRKRLLDAYATFFGAAFFGNALEHNESYSLDVKDGLAWVAKDTGALTLQKYSRTVAVSVVKNAEHAVQLAARHLGELGLCVLTEHESLDLIDVSATMNASWVPETDGTFSPVPVRDLAMGKDVSQFISQHKVVFGRRYRGIPVAGGSLKAIIDANGLLVGLLQEWRDIAGDSPVSVAVDDDATIEDRRDSAKKLLVLESRTCGYFEASFVGWVQNSPGVGCLYRSIVPNGSGLDRIQVDLVSMTSDPTSSLTGLPLSGQP